jgi:hypothetical protein
MIIFCCLCCNPVSGCAIVTATVFCFICVVTDFALAGLSSYWVDNWCIPVRRLSDYYYNPYDPYNGYDSYNPYDDNWPYVEYTYTYTYWFQGTILCNKAFLISFFVIGGIFWLAAGILGVVYNQKRNQQEGSVFVQSYTKGNSQTEASY